MDGFVRWFQQLQFDNLIELLIIAVSSLFCITVHETSHGLCAYWLGDQTAKRAGRLTLNPIRHIDPIGLLMMVVAKFGWAKPVPVNMYNFKNPKRGMAITALAGPVSNVLLMLSAAVLRVVTIFFYIQYETHALLYVSMFFEYTLYLSAGLAVFNLFPVPPLDGSKVLFALLPDSTYKGLMRYERFGMLLLVALLYLNVLDVPLLYLRSGLLEFSNIVIMPLIEILQRI